MSLTIYGIAASRAIRPLWAACELAVPFQHVPTPYQGGATRTADFLAINPNGHIPVLLDERAQGPVVVWESMACALYLAQEHGLHDGIDISPAGAAEQAEALRWSFWTLTELEKDALTVLAHRRTMPVEQRKPELAEAAERRLRVPLRVLEHHLQQWATQLGGVDTYLAGARFTVADVCVASVVNWVRASEVLEDFPAVKAWSKRCLDRPAHRQARSMG
jgi:glutathione S-transferase